MGHSKVKSCGEVKRNQDGSITTAVIKGYGSCSNSEPPMVVSGNLGVSGGLIFQSIPFTSNSTVQSLTSTVYRWSSLIDLRLAFTVTGPAYDTSITVGSIPTAYAPSSVVALAVSSSPLTEFVLGNGYITTGGLVLFTTSGIPEAENSSFVVHASYLAGSPLTCTSCIPTSCNSGCSGYYGQFTCSGSNNCNCGC